MKSAALLAAALVGASTTTLLAAPAPAATSAPASTSVPATASPQALASAQAIVAVAFPPERRQGIMDKMMQTMLAQMKAGMVPDTITDPGLKKILFDYIDQMPALLRPATSAFIPKQMDAITQAYARMFTPAELKNIEAFAHTPSGQAYLQRSTDILSDPGVAAVNTAYFREAQGITMRSAAGLQAKVNEYLKAHPELAKQQP